MNRDGSQRSFLERMVEEVPGAIYALSAGGVVLHRNRGAEELFGYTADEATGRSLGDLIVPEELREEAVRMGASDRKPFLVALTGYGRPEDIRRAEEVGFEAHLTKPVEVARIEELLSRRRDAGRGDRA